MVRRLAIHGGGPLQRDVRSPETGDREERAVQGDRFPLPAAQGDGESRGGQRAGAAPGNFRIGVGNGRDDAAHSRPQDGVDAGRRPARVIARLEGDVEISAAGEGSRGGQG